MPDRLGRYLNVKEIDEIAPAWAKGCDKCRGGIVNARRLPSVTHIVEERIRQMENSELHFCSCKAGQMYERYLVKASAKLAEMYDQMAKSVNAMSPDEKEDIES